MKLEPLKGDPEAIVTRVFERGECVYVEGKVIKAGAALNAAFAVHKPDIWHMTREEFHAFAVRRLPEVTEEIRYSPTGEVLV
jgi:hypothetical protein